MRLELSFCKDWSSRFTVCAAQWRLIHDDGGTSVLDYGQVKALLRDKRVGFILHGYDNNYDGAFASYERIRGGLGHETYDVWIYCYWPAHTKLGFWMATGKADDCAGLFADVVNNAEARSVTIAAHSLGCRVALASLKAIRRPVDLVVLMAPAVDDESIQTGEKYAVGVSMVSRVVVCFSTADRVLGVWYRRFGSFLSNLFSFGDAALGFNGPEDWDRVSQCVSGLNGSGDDIDHSDWKSYEVLFRRWKSEIEYADSGIN